jgi:alpha-tubulin suppressor-like RCC1 family protein
MAIVVPNVHAVAIAAGYSHTAAVLTDGRVQCWGGTSDGQLGNGVRGPGGISTPVFVSNLNGAVSVTAGYGHTCAVLSDGSVWCWGSNKDGELGNGMSGQFDVPVKVVNISNPISVSAGYFHTCALLRDGTLKAWGANTFGALANGNDMSSNVPVP